MEKSVNDGIREDFYYDLIETYERQAEASFLYRYFWAESVAELLEEHFPQLPVAEPLAPKNGPRIKKRLGETMKERPEWARGLLLKPAPGKARKERRDFWEELWLNDAGYSAGLISDTEYYLWLVDYLSARDIYYKDKGSGKRNRNGHTWLYRLLLAGLQMEPGQLQTRDGENIRTKAQVGRDLAKLARMIQDERSAGEAETAGRLHDLKLQVKTAGGMIVLKDYLPWLTAMLARMALHIKIKTWLQDSGYPLVEEGWAKDPPKKPRKQDFSMRLFEAYCDSAEGYEFHRKAPGGKAAAQGWRLDGLGFCVLEPDQFEPLLEVLERRGNAAVYLPLAVDLYSGCVFFLAGKENYKNAYRTADEEARKAYRNAEARFCFDYLRLDRGRRKGFPGDVGGAFQLRPTFHENAGKSYQAVLSAFKRYCMAGKNSARQAVRAFNGTEPAGIPDVFRWAFDV